jgi:molybdate transport system regulatory protein
MTSPQKHKTTAKIWLEHKGQPLLGKGGAEILHAIKAEHSISKAAQKTEMSYRYIWNYIAKLQKNLTQPVVTTHKGRTKGRGGAKLTKLGENLLKEYKRAEAYVGEVLQDTEYWVAATLKISARNRLKGTVKTVDKGDIIAKVKLEIKTPATITALISREAVDDLNIKPGDNAEAVIKATEIMIAKE